MTASPGFRLLQGWTHRCPWLLSKTYATSPWEFSMGVIGDPVSARCEGERLFELQHRLDSLPDDLEKLFGNIIDRLDAKYFERAARFLQIVRASILPLSLLETSFADEDDPDFAIKAPPGPLTTKQISPRAELMRRRISACCKGLLEAKTDQKTRLADTKVGYLYRSEKDYLEHEDTSAKLRAAIQTDFNINLRLFNSQMMKLKRRLPETLEDYPLWRPITYAIEYAVRADPSCDGHQIALLDEMDKIAIELTTMLLQDESTFLQRSSRGSGETATHWTWTIIDCRKSRSFSGLTV